MPGKENAKDKADGHDPELDFMLGRLRFIRQDLRQRFEDVAKQLGISVADLEAYVNDAKNFPAALWQDAETQAEELRRRLDKAREDPAKLRKSVAEVQSESSNRRHKTLGARKKWIPIR